MPKKLRMAWATDIHLDHASKEAAADFYEEINTGGYDSLLITGDIATCRDLGDAFLLLDKKIRLPIYLVLGNHDAYYGSVLQSQVWANSEARDSGGKLTYLTRSDPIWLSKDTVLIGHDGWYDAKGRDGWESKLYMSDFELIGELKEMVANKAGRHKVMEELAQMSANRIGRQIEAVTSKPPARHKAERIIIATHVPPYRQAAFHKGRPSDATWGPYFTNLTLGEELSDEMALHPESHAEVYCGHTHGRGQYRAAPNIIVHTGAAEYGSPRLCGVIEI